MQYMGRSRDLPYRCEECPGAVFPNSIWQVHVGIAQSTVTVLIARGRLVPWRDVRGLDGLVCSRLVKALSVERSKPRLIYDARPLNWSCQHVALGMYTVALVALVAEEDCLQVSVDDKSDFHHLLLQPESWTLFRVEWAGADCVCTTLPFGWSESSLVYHSLTSAREISAC